MWFGALSSLKINPQKRELISTSNIPNAKEFASQMGFGKGKPPNIY